jgi:hypothetical protein
MDPAARLPRPVERAPRDETVMELTIEDLEKLPLRAFVALAAGCARRVQPLSQLHGDHPEEEECGAAIDAAIRMAESFSKGSDGSLGEEVVQSVDRSRVAPGNTSAGAIAAVATEAARAATAAGNALDSRDCERVEPWWEKTAENHEFQDHLANVTADLAALIAFTATEEAVEGVGLSNESLTAGGIRDYERLLGPKLGSYPGAGPPIDPSPDGPRGPL